MKFMEKNRRSKEALYENTTEDNDIARGAMRELIDVNRKLSRKITDEFKHGDYGLLEEYAQLADNIFKGSKLLVEINQTAPKTFKDIQSLQEQKEKINLKELMDD